MAIKLTLEQEQIIQAPNEHCVINAVAGSGKTTTLAYRIKYLLTSGVPARRILVLMFNRHAKEDFDLKMQGIAEGLDIPEVRTFHSIGYRIYQRLIKEGHLPRFNPNILSEHEIQFQLWRLIRELAPSDIAESVRRNKNDYVDMSEELIEAVKARVLDPVDVYDECGFETKNRFLINVFHAFEAWRKQENRISFSDMIYDPVMLLKKQPQLQSLIADKMDFVLADEYQDTSQIQHVLLAMIAGKRAKVTIVGDPDQTIYEFRGARPEYLLGESQRDFAPVKSFDLTYSFRYGHKVSLMANHLISQNRFRKTALCSSHPNNPNTEITSLQSAFEHQDIADRLESAPQSLSETAVLLRTWSQSVPLELECLSRGIPYSIQDHQGVFNTREVKALTALLELSCGQIEQYSQNRKVLMYEQLLKFPHVGIKEQWLQSIAQSLAQVNASQLSIAHVSLPPECKKFQEVKLSRTLETLRSIYLKDASALTILEQYIEETELFDSIRSMSLSKDVAKERIGTVNGFLSFIKAIDGRPSDMLRKLSLLRQKAKLQAPSGVLLTTIHRAKGLEWNHVILPGLNARKYPYEGQLMADPERHVESERRLFYVAITRAKQSLSVLLPAQNSEVSLFYHQLNMPLCEAVGDYVANGSGQLDDLLLTPIAKRYMEKNARFIEQEPAQLAIA